MTVAAVFYLYTSLVRETLLLQTFRKMGRDETRRPCQSDETEARPETFAAISRNEERRSAGSLETETFQKHVSRPHPCAPQRMFSERAKHFVFNSINKTEHEIAVVFKKSGDESYF